MSPKPKDSVPNVPTDPNQICSVDSITNMTTVCSIRSVLLFFRPKQDYEGEFGFDWMRDGDMTTINLDDKNKSLLAIDPEKNQVNNYRHALSGQQLKGGENTIEDLFNFSIVKEELADTLTWYNSLWTHANYPMTLKTTSAIYKNPLEVKEGFYKYLTLKPTTPFTNTVKMFFENLRNARGKNVFLDTGINQILKKLSSQIVRAYINLDREYSIIPILKNKELEIIPDKYLWYWKHWLSIFPKPLADTMNTNLGIGAEYPLNWKNNRDREKKLILMQHTATLRIYAENISNGSINFTNIEPSILYSKNSTIKSLYIKFNLTRFDIPKKKDTGATVENNFSKSLDKTLIGEVTITSNGILEYDTEIEFFIIQGNQKSYSGSIIVCKNDFRPKNWENHFTNEEVKKKFLATIAGTTKLDARSKQTINAMAQKPKEKDNKQYSDGSRRQDVLLVNIILNSPNNNSTNSQANKIKGGLDYFQVKNEGDTPHAGGLPSLYKGFHQCLLYGKVFQKDLDLSADTEFSKVRNNFKDNMFSDDVWLVPVHKSTTGHKFISPEGYNALPEQDKVKYQAEKCLIVKDHRLDSSKRSTFNTNYYPQKNDLIQNKGSELLILLVQKLKKNFESSEFGEIWHAIKNNCVIMFNIPAYLSTSGGWAYLNSNFVVHPISSNLKHSNTAIHEALHSMGIAHSFLQGSSDDMKFHFNPQASTDNIMSYNRYSMAQLIWHWQSKEVKIFSTNNRWNQFIK